LGLALLVRREVLNWLGVPNARHPWLAGVTTDLQRPSFE
jgi:hypothetical protein